MSQTPTPLPHDTNAQTQRPRVSILMLTHNAPDYVELSIRSVQRTQDVDWELVVVDNASESPTVELVTRLKAEGLIHVLKLLDYNSFFAEGNNIAAGLARPDATHYLLLNSDIEVRRSDWLANLLALHTGGLTGYGVAENPLRLDGYSLLIDAELYKSEPLDEGHQWFWAVTKQQASLMREGAAARGYRHHERWLHHFGGKSGDAFTSALGREVSRSTVTGWFGGTAPRIIHTWDPRQVDWKTTLTPRQAARRLKTRFARDY